MFRTCSGLILTSYSRIDQDNSFKEILSLAIDEYKIHKKRFILAEKFKGYKMQNQDIFFNTTQCVMNL